MSKVGLKWSHNAFFYLPIKVFFTKLTTNREREREKTHLENIVQQRVVCYVQEE